MMPYQKVVGFVFCGLTVGIIVFVVAGHTSVVVLILHRVLAFDYKLGMMISQVKRGVKFDGLELQLGLWLGQPYGKRRRVRMGAT